MIAQGRYGLIPMGKGYIPPLCKKAYRKRFWREEVERIGDNRLKHACREYLVEFTPMVASELPPELYKKYGKNIPFPNPEFGDSDRHILEIVDDNGRTSFVEAEYHGDMWYNVFVSALPVCDRFLEQQLVNVYQIT